VIQQSDSMPVGKSASGAMECMIMGYPMERGCTLVRNKLLHDSRVFVGKLLGIYRKKATRPVISDKSAWNKDTIIPLLQRRFAQLPLEEGRFGKCAYRLQDDADELSAPIQKRIGELQTAIDLLKPKGSDGTTDADYEAAYHKRYPLGISVGQMHDVFNIGVMFGCKETKIPGKYKTDDGRIKVLSNDDVCGFFTTLLNIYKTAVQDAKDTQESKREADLSSVTGTDISVFAETCRLHFLSVKVNKIYDVVTRWLQQKNKTGQARRRGKGTEKESR